MPRPIPPQAELRFLFRYDPETGHLFWKRRPNDRAGCSIRGGRRTVQMEGKAWQEHRLIWKLVYGTEPRIVDHVNRDPSDNRLTNLRAVTAGQNVRNTGIYRNNTSGLKGVSWHKPARRWRAVIQHKREHRFLGLFRTRREAGLAYDAAARRLFGPHACTNHSLGLLPAPCPEVDE